MQKINLPAGKIIFQTSDQLGMAIRTDLSKFISGSPHSIFEDWVTEDEFNEMKASYGSEPANKAEVKMVNDFCEDFLLEQESMTEEVRYNEALEHYIHIR